MSPGTYKWTIIPWNNLLSRGQSSWIVGYLLIHGDAISWMRLFSVLIGKLLSFITGFCGGCKFLGEGYPRKIEPPRILMIPHYAICLRRHTCTIGQQYGILSTLPFVYRRRHISYCYPSLQMPPETSYVVDINRRWYIVYRIYIVYPLVACDEMGRRVSYKMNQHCRWRQHVPRTFAHFVS